MKRRRDKIAILVDMLEVIGNGARKTHIVYKANLNFESCRRYLNAMRNADLVDIQVGSPMKWAITEKGRTFLKKYKEFTNISL
ncbi:unnamed protein product [marine sediment metagenome]|uniref:ArnR1-like winged helix-turn-helix domain-containing protein n=1 Tax=marine sediment metagenome TaxID=412755 RepID=X1PSP4_9ZZZZ